VDIEFSLALPRDAIGIPMVRRVLGDAMRSLGVSESCISDMLLAVSEACSNAVRHGGPSGRYEVTAAIGSGRCDVRVAENGRGLLIMRSVVDEISFGIVPGRGTTVHLRKHLERCEESETLACRLTAV